jgi:hypothetical protein
LQDFKFALKMRILNELVLIFSYQFRRCFAPNMQISSSEKLN